MAASTNHTDSARDPAGETKDPHPERVVSLRPHHIGCLQFWEIDYSERGRRFLQTEERLRKTLSSGGEAPIAVREGPDELCRECPRLVEGRCTHPRGDETDVRKWDKLVLRELGVPYGSCLTAAEWRRRIAERWPFRLCQRCQWREECRAGREIRS
ncbi:MAG: DUF1284 domain-containing protein [Chloroflexota bacterium]